MDDNTTRTMEGGAAVGTHSSDGSAPSLSRVDRADGIIELLPQASAAIEKLLSSASEAFHESPWLMLILAHARVRDS